MNASSCKFTWKLEESFRQLSNGCFVDSRRCRSCSNLLRECRISAWEAAAEVALFCGQGVNVPFMSVCLTRMGFQAEKVLGHVPRAGARAVLGARGRYPSRLSRGRGVRHYGLTGLWDRFHLPSARYTSVPGEAFATISWHNSLPIRRQPEGGILAGEARG